MRSILEEGEMSIVVIMYVFKIFGIYILWLNIVLFDVYVFVILNICIRYIIYG